MSHGTELKIDGMTCAHCVRAVKGALEALPGVRNADVDLASGVATVVHDAPLDRTRVAEAIKEEGYELRAG